MFLIKNKLALLFLLLCVTGNCSINSKDGQQKYSTMMRVERIVVKPSNEKHKAIKRACVIARALYNTANYQIRQSFFDENAKTLKHHEIDKAIKKEPGGIYSALLAAASQRNIQVQGDNWTSYFEAVKTYRSEPGKFKKRPRPPKYARGAKTFYVGRNGFKIEAGWLIFPKQLNIKPFKIICCKNQPFNVRKEEAVVQDVRFVPLGNSFTVEIVHKVREKPKPDVDIARVFGIDIGINNLAAIISNQPEYVPALINGKILKSINAKYNKDCVRLRSVNKHGHLKSKFMKRQNQINNYLHKASRFIISEAISHKIGHLIIGHNPDWKQSVNIGKANNQKFVSIPHARFIEMVMYKAEELGIKVTVREESYTSKASALDLDEIPTYDPENKSETKTFSGRRVKRGLYKAGSGRLINADINGP